MTEAIERDLTTEDVLALARSVGIAIPPAHLPAVAERLREMFALAADLADLDLEGVEPAMRFHPDWPDEAPA